MGFRITGLSPDPFRNLFGLTDDQLAALGAQRMIADSHPGYPDRVTLRDAEAGQSLILVNYEHQPAETPYRSRHAIFVLEGAQTAFDAVDVIPEVMATRWMSLRAFDGRDMMVDAALAAGPDLIDAIDRMLEGPQVVYVQAHYATRGCYAARITRP